MDSRKAAEDEGIFVPTTEKEYIILTQQGQSSSCQDPAPTFTMDDMFDDYYEYSEEDDSEDEDGTAEEYSSANEESETKKSKPSTTSSSQKPGSSSVQWVKNGVYTACGNRAVESVGQWGDYVFELTAAVKESSQGEPFFHLCMLRGCLVVYMRFGNFVFLIFIKFTELLFDTS